MTVSLDRGPQWVDWGNRFAFLEVQGSKLIENSVHWGINPQPLKNTNPLFFGKPPHP